MLENCTNCEDGRVLRKAFTLDGISYPECMVNCYDCNGTGQKCEFCGEASNVCDGTCDEDTEQDVRNRDERLRRPR